MPESTTFGAVDDEPEMVSDYRKLLRPPPLANDRSPIMIPALKKTARFVRMYRAHLSWFFVIPTMVYFASQQFGASDGFTHGLTLAVLIVVFAIWSGPGLAIHKDE